MAKQKQAARAYVSGGRVFFRAAAGGKVYALRVPPGVAADDCAAMARVGLASGQWPPAIAGAAGVRRYLADVAGVALARNGEARGGDVIGDFLALIAGEVTAQWRRQCGQYLRDFAAFCGGDITAATQAQAAQWLAQAKAPATRAKKLIVLRRFWRRALPGRLCPFDGLRAGRAARAQTDIDYYPPATRDKLLEMAAALPRRGDCLAVYIALLAGLRANEVARLDWSAVDLRAGRLVAQSKRGAPRAVPLAGRLRAALEAVPA
ncbi:MAG: hypothetical protein J6P03_00345, partial [Opitutales bacterium]|nr:hypothetical protein [Opitutales bacterium]